MMNDKDFENLCRKFEEIQVQYFGPIGELSLIDNIAEIKKNIKTMSPTQQKNFLQLKCGIHGRTPLMLLALLANYDDFKLCLNGLDADKKYELLKIQDGLGFTAQALMLEEDVDEESSTEFGDDTFIKKFNFCLEGLSANQKYQLLKIQEKGGQTALMMVARHNPESLKLCLEGLSGEQKYELLNIKDNSGWTALMHELCFKELSAEQKYELLETQDKDGWTALMQVVVYNPDNLELCLKGLNAKQKYELLETQDKDGWTALMLVAEYCPRHFELCLKGLNAKQKYELLEIENTDGWTAQKLVNYFHPNYKEALSKLVKMDKVDKPSTLNKDTESRIEKQSENSDKSAISSQKFFKGKQKKGPSENGEQASDNQLYKFNRQQKNSQL